MGLLPSSALVMGWEAFIVLLDVRGLSPRRAEALTPRTVEAILDAALAGARSGSAEALTEGDRGRGHVTRASERRTRDA